MRLSFVIPVYNERETIRGVVDGVLEHARGHDLELLLVDDGSDDGSAGTIDALAQEHGEIRVIRFSKNLGKSAALAVGFAKASGDVVFTLDSDLQDDPKEIPRFLAKLDEGYQLVCGWKAVRHDPWHKTLPSRLYNAFVARLWHLPLHDINCGFKAMRSDVAKSIRLYHDMHRLIPVLAVQNGFNVAEIAVEHHPRRFGKSKYGIERFVSGAIDVFALWGLMRDDRYPGRLLAQIGGITLGLGISMFLSGVLNLHPAWTLALVVGGFVVGTVGGMVAAMALAVGRVTRDLDRTDPSPYIVDGNPK